MALSFYTTLDDVMFSSELSRLILAADGGETSASFTLISGTGELFSNTYTPDENGRIYIYDLNKIIDDAITEVHGEFTFTVGTVTKTITVVRCNTRVDIGAADFVNSHFLTPCQHARATSRYRRELLTLLSLADEAVEVTATAYYYTEGATSLAKAVKTLASVSGAATIDVSPAQFINEALGRLVGYTVNAGNRSQRYDVVSHNPDAVGVIYRNSFHAWDTFHFGGMLATEWEHTRSSAVVGGRLRAYDIEQIQLFKAYTGPIPYGNEVLPYELCRSMELYQLEASGDIGDEIIVTEAEIKSDNAPDTINDFIVTYRLADSFTTKIRTPKAVNLFDHTFDETFN